MFVIWGAPWAIINVYDSLIGQEFLSASSPKIGKILTDWNPDWWVIWLLVGVFLFLLVTFEGAYRIVHKKTQSAKEFLVAKQTTRKPPWDFYLNRKDLATARGTLSEELKGMQKIWAIWTTGGNVLENDEMLSKNINPKEFKLILSDPNDDDMMGNIEPRGGGNKERWKIQIQSIAGQVHRIGGAVYFYRGIIGDDLLVADPIFNKDNKFSDNAWARVDTTIPYRANSKRSSYKVIKKEALGQFESLVEHFNTLIGRVDRITEYKGEFDHLSST